MPNLDAGVVASTPVAQDIAQKIKRTPGQVLLRWAVQKGIHVTPKSNQVPWRDRQWDNGNETEEMARNGVIKECVHSLGSSAWNDSQVQPRKPPLDSCI